MQIIISSLKQSFSTPQSLILKDQNTRDHSAWTIRERGSHARGVYPTQYTSRMGAAKMKWEEEAETRIMQESSKKSGRKESGHEEEKSYTRPN